MNEAVKNLTLDADSRDKLVRIGVGIGGCLHERPSGDVPIKILLSGGFKSGKSLLALAIHYAFEPAAYPKGIGPKHSADRAMEWQAGASKPVVFKNFLRKPAGSRAEFERLITEFHSQSPAAKVLIAANINLNLGEIFDPAARGARPAPVDMRIEVSSLGEGGQSRLVSINTADTELYDKLSRRLA